MVYRPLDQRVTERRSVSAAEGKAIALNKSGIEGKLPSMRRSCLQVNYAVVTAIMVALVLYGCLYPFVFRRPLHNIGPVHQLLSSWSEWHGRGDFLSNIALYLPLGFFAVLANRYTARLCLTVVFWTLAAGFLSLGVELTQYYDVGRTTAAIDVYSNVFGAALGAVAAVVAVGNSHRPFLREVAEHRVPALLLLAWLGYRLFAAGSAVDPRAGWLVLRPIVLYSTLTFSELFRATAIWLTVALVVEAVFGERRFWLLFALLAGGSLGAKLLIAPMALRLSDVVGAAAALLFTGLSRGGRFRAAVVLLLLAVAVIGPRLYPLPSRPGAHHFEWILFRSLMRGSQHDAATFLQKSFLYGSAIWLLAETGWRLPVATILVAAALLITASMQSHLVGASADITDTVMAIIIGVIMTLVKMDPGGRAACGEPAAAGRVAS